MGPAVLDVLAAHTIIPVVRETDAGRARMVVAALYRAGFRVFEITLTVPGAVELIRELAADEELTVGVGTVFDYDDAERATEAGASFVVAPAALPEVAEAARAGGAVAVLAGLTPTEVVTARRSGADAVKIFPAASMGGAAHVKALVSVFPDVPFIPTGGVGLGDMHDYLRAGAHSVGLGASLTGGRDADAIEAAGLRYLAALRERRRGGEESSDG